MSQESVRKENHILRSVTAIMMMFIAFAHYYSQYEVGDMEILGWHLMSLGRFVIPVFVMISGYFCFSKDGHAEASLKKKALHILILIVIFKLFYVIFSTILCIAGIVDPGYILQEFLTVSPGYEFDVYGGTKLIMTTQPIWFIYALFLIYGLWYLLYSRKIDFKWSLVLAVPVSLIAVVAVDLLPLFGVNEVFGIEIDGGVGGIMYPFTVLPFFVMGYYLHKYKDLTDEKLSNTMIWLLMILGIIITIFEVWLRPGHYNSSIYLGLVLFSVMLFIGTFRVPEDRARCFVLEYIGKYLTMWMYVFFAAANFIIRYLFQPYADDLIICEVLGPIVALILDIAMAFAFHLFMSYRAQKKRAAREQAQQA